MEQSGTNVTGPSRLVVLPIPDVSSELEGLLPSKKYVPIPLKRSKSNQKRTFGNSLVLLGVFLFYAAIGILAANIIVWFYSGEEPEVSRTVNELQLDVSSSHQSSLLTRRTSNPSLESNLLRTNKQGDSIDSIDPAIAGPFRRILTIDSTSNRNLKEVDEVRVARNPVDISMHSGNVVKPDNNRGGLHSPEMNLTR